MNKPFNCRLAGIDLAWKGETNPSSIAIGSIANNELLLEDIYSEIIGMDACMHVLEKDKTIKGIAIDASLIINNMNGFRNCELELNQLYRTKWASCYPTNLKLYSDAFSVELSKALISLGFEYYNGNKWQIECYPHASMIEIFGLPKRLSYKKGNVASKKEGQKQLASLILKLEHAQPLKLKIPSEKQVYVSHDYIDTLKGRALKINEDNLDAMICLYTAGLYEIQSHGITFGDAIDGAIWVPQGKCIE
jgi:predicted RNase H-like nuclease